jgi:hypothetical protein
MLKQGRLGIDGNSKFMFSTAADISSRVDVTIAFYVQKSTGFLLGSIMRERIMY